jgi:hypothetical protein
MIPPTFLCSQPRQWPLLRILAYFCARHPELSGVPVSRCAQDTYALYIGLKLHPSRSLIAIGSLLNRRGFYKRLAGCAIELKGQKLR